MIVESTQAALALLDRFSVMVRTLGGDPIPDPPALPGRRHRGPSDPPADPLAEAWAAKHATPDTNP